MKIKKTINSKGQMQYLCGGNMISNTEYNLLLDNLITGFSNMIGGSDSEEKESVGNSDVDGDEGRTRKTIPSLVQVSPETQKRADILHRENMNGQFGGPLAQAAYKGELELCAALINAGATIDEKSLVDGLTPLYLASQTGKQKVVELLLNQNANKDEQSSDGTTALSVASEGGQTEVVEILLVNEAIVNLPNNEGATPLLLASLNGSSLIVSILLKHGANVDQPDVLGNTPIYYASESGYAEICKELLKHGANVNQLNNAGETPLDIAQLNGNDEIVCLLQPQ